MTVTMLLTVASLIGCRNEAIQSTQQLPEQSPDRRPLSSEWHLLWSRSNVYVRHDNAGRMMVASNGRLFVLSSNNPLDDGNVRAFDGLTGEIDWENGAGSETTLVAIENAIYAGYAGTGKVVAYAQDDGHEMWSSFLPNAHSVSYLTSADAIIYATTNNDLVFQLETSSGKVTDIQASSTVPLYAINEKSLVRDSLLSYVSLIRMPDQMVVWEANVRSAVLQPVVVDDEKVYIRTERALGELHVIDFITGKLVWKTERTIVSNPVSLGKSVFCLTRDGKLVEFDSATGYQQRHIELGSAPFTLSGEAEVGGYYLAIDVANSTIFAYLGDSSQLIALSLEDRQP